MAQSFTTFALGPEHVLVAFPLVNAVLPKIDFGQWKDFITPLLATNAPETGVIGLRGSGNYICGLAAHRLERDLLHGATFAVDLFVTLDFFQAERATIALLEAIQTQARSSGCKTLRVSLPPEHRSIMEFARPLGFMPCGLLVSKPVERIKAH